MKKIDNKAGKKAVAKKVTKPAAKADVKKAVKKAPAPQKAVGLENLPLFFTKPVVLDAKNHEKAAVTERGFKFAKKTNSIPLNAAELIEAAKYYPIVFTNNANPTPCAIVGFEQDNYFIDAKGEWKADTYIPAYVRKYPFAFTEIIEAKQLVLCVDEGSEHFSAQGKGKKLYDAGKPSIITQNALEFCTAFHNHYITTIKFGAVLKEAGLLIENQSEVKLQSGRNLKLNGFQLIDEAKFNALPDAKIAQLRKQGWLAPVYFALQATSNWRNLVEMAAKIENPKK